MGNNVSASGVHSIALGNSDNPTTTAGATTTHYTSSEGENSIAVGYAAIAQTDNSIAIGTRAVTYTADTSSTTLTKTGINSIAIGYETVTRKDYATAIGNSASAEGTESTALGNKTTAVGTESLAVGSQSTTNGDGSASIGRSNAVTGTDVAAVGSRNISSGSWGGITDSGLFGYTNKIQAYSDTNVSNTVTGVYILGSNNEVNQADKINKVTNVTLLGQGNSVTAGSNATSYQNTINNVTVIGGSNKVIGREESTTSWSTLENDTVLGYGNTIDASQQATPVSNIQILGNNVTATLGNSVYLGTGAAYVSAEPASNDAETLAVQQGDAEAEASDEYNAATTDTERNTIKQKYEAKYLYKARVAAMEAKGTTAGVSQYDQDNTYENTSSYTYAAGTPAGVVTVGSDGKERRIQNVAAGLVSASSTDAVNGSQLYALTRQLRFGGDNSSFGTTTADDKNVVARGSNETLNIIGGEKDTTKLTDNNIGVLADSTNNTLTVKLASNLKDLNTAQLGSGSGDSYKETIKLDGTGTTGGQMTLAGADGTVKTTLDTTSLTIANGPKFISSGIDAASQKINHVTAGTDDADAANVGQVNAAAAEATTEVKAGTNASLGTVETSAADKHKIYTVNVDNLAVKAANGNASVALANGINFKNGTNTTSAVDASGNVTIDTKNLTLKANVGTPAAVTMDGGINFKDGTNTTATVDTDGTVKISATHNKLNATGAATTATADSNAVTLTLEDADGNKTTTALTDTYTTISKDGANKKVTFKRNDGETQTLELSDLGGITEAQDKYITGGTVSYDTNGNGTAALTGTNGITASITGLKDTKVSSGTVNYVGTQGNASGSATLTMNDGSKVAITGLKDDYITSAAVGAETNHVTMTRLGGGTVDLNLNPILEKYSLSDYRLVGNGDSQDQAYQVNADGTVTLNVVDAKNTANKRTIQITGLASQSGVNAGRTTVKSSDNSVTVSDSTANSDTHTYDIKVDYSKIPGHVSLSYIGDTGSGSNTLNNSVKFAGTTNQVTTTAKDGQVTFALASDIKGINSVTTGNTTLSTNGVSNGKMSLTGTGMTITDTDASKQISVTTKGVFMGSQRIQNVANAEVDTDAATLGQVKNARTVVAGGSNVASVTPSEGANNQMTYTVNVDNLSVKANKETAKSVTLKNGLTFNDGTNTTASVGSNGEVKYDLNFTLTGLTSVTAGNSTLDTNAVNVAQLKEVNDKVGSGWQLAGNDGQPVSDCQYGICRN